MLSTRRYFHVSTISKILRQYLSSRSNHSYIAKPTTKLQESYYHHASSLPFIYKTVGQHLDSLASASPRHECYIFSGEDKRYTYKSFKDEVDSVATSLLQLGFEKHDRLGVWLPNTSENVAMTYICSKLGIIKVNINPAYLERELQYCLNKVGCKGLIMQPKVKTIDCLNILHKITPELQHSKPGDLKSQAVPTLKHVILTGSKSVASMHSYNELLNNGGNGRQKTLFEYQDLMDSDTPLAIFYTSGTTGTPKAATLTNFNIINNGHALQAIDPDFMKKVCCPIPLFHIFGEVCGTFNASIDGNTVVFPALLPDTVATMKSINEEKCTAIIGAPIIFRDLLSHSDRKKYNLSSLEFAIIGAAPSAPALLEQLEQEIPIKNVCQGYGMTENAAAMTLSAFAGSDKIKRFGSVGKAMPRLEVKLVNENGETVAVGHEGEVWVRGYNVMKGYYGDLDKTREILTESNWLKTGDVAVMDEEGYLYFRSRQKEMVIIGGINVYPTEIENVITEHPKIAEAQVFGVTDKRYGEELCAWIKLKPNEHIDIKDIEGFLSNRVAFFKIPKHIKIVNSFADYTTPTGKVQKFKLSHTVAKELNRI
ncbi:unnamed protein product [Didymodactylos carnosus]|uniref:Uncharacterized protein n=1 Tax=Didymodactylos carnosus TaxID=1234261 RepID=A0A813Z0C1_9BILA|nr:unnamed protein product [Didymodactylos carnosus]CAF1127770.1 unnamed protein product [Didymodactylos carnosus]CAF3675752.1 unnamed protein product [Didymodactylos carnosus]CAF3907562.1 unnamed protein product [Didymodactylos carnosus]